MLWPCLDPITMSLERSTRQRTAMRTAIEAAGRPLTPQEILELAQAEVPALGMATVYRNLKSMADAGEIEAVVLPGDAPRYESAHIAHHHHFQCNACKRVFDVHQCSDDLNRMAPKGFVVETHALTLYGQCGDCVAAPALAGA